VTVNVADWWPYAALTLCLGVLLAFTIGRFYTNTRPARAARVLAAQVGHEIASTESDWQRKHAGTPLGGYSMAGLARDWVGWVLRTLEAGDAGAATAHLNNLDAYAKAYRAFLQHLERLASAVAAVEKKTADDQAAALATARALLKGQDLPFDPSLSQKPDLKERETALAAELEAKDKEVGAAIKALAPYEAQMLREILPQGLPREQQPILPLSLVWQDLGPLTQGRTTQTTCSVSAWNCRRPLPPGRPNCAGTSAMVRLPSPSRPRPPACRPTTASPWVARARCACCWWRTPAVTRPAR
jgi:hypothetical protein